MASRPLSSSTPAGQEPPDFEDFLDTFPIPVPPKDAAKPKKARVPSRASGIDINFCKTPRCANFGVPVQPTAQRGQGAQNPYTIVAYGKGIPSARCNCCGVSFPIKSNAGVHEEYPEQVAKIMTIYRALHNYVWIGEGKKTTPAMRLGLAEKPCGYEDVLSFS